MALSMSAYDLVENPIFEVEVKTEAAEPGNSVVTTSKKRCLAPVDCQTPAPGTSWLQSQYMSAAYDPVEVKIENPILEAEVETTEDPWSQAQENELAPATTSYLPPAVGIYQRIVYIDHKKHQHVRYSKIPDEELAQGQFEPVDAAGAGSSNEVRRNAMVNGLSTSRNGEQSYDNKFILMKGLKKLGSNSSKPYVCPVPSCGKSYKNANGIRYHARYGHTVSTNILHCFCGRSYSTKSGFVAHQKQSHRNEYRKNIKNSQIGNEVEINRSKSDASKSKDNDVVACNEAANSQLREQQRQQQQEQDDLETYLFMNTVGDNEAIVRVFGSDTDEDEEENQQQLKIAIQRSMGNAYFEIEKNRNQNKENEDVGQEEDDDENIHLDSVQEFRVKIEPRSSELTNQQEGDGKDFDRQLYTPRYILRWGLKKTGSNPEKPYDCPVPNCNKAYKNANGIKYHSRFGHPDQKDFTCDCGKNYATRHGFFVHQKSVHGLIADSFEKMYEEKLFGAPITFQNGQNINDPARNQINDKKIIFKKPKLEPFEASTHPEEYGKGKGKGSYFAYINESFRISEDIKPVINTKRVTIKKEKDDEYYY